MALTTYRNRRLDSIPAATLETAKADLLNGALLIVNHQKTTGSRFYFTAHVVANVNGEQRLYGITLPLIATGFVGKSRDGNYGTVSTGGRSVGGEVSNTVGLVLGIDPFDFHTATLS